MGKDGEPEVTETRTTKGAGFLGRQQHVVVRVFPPRVPLSSLTSLPKGSPIASRSLRAATPAARKEGTNEERAVWLLPLSVPLLYSPLFLRRSSFVPPCSPLRLSFPHYTHSTRGAAGSPEGASRPGGRYAVYGG